MEKLRMKEPVILHIRDSHNALQRCFIIFENQEITGSDYSSETGYVLKMNAFRFDREEILRQLMYLGPNVRLAEPADLREELQQRLKQAQKNNMMNNRFSTDK
jgi:predicted DNA-binding transcriptional regulator YafY